MIKSLAQRPSNPFPEGFRGLGPLGYDNPSNSLFTEITSTTKFEKVLSITIGVMTVIAGIWFMIQMFLAAIEWLSSSGEKQAIQNAQKKIVNSLVGLLIVVVSYGLLLTIGNIFGIKLLNPGNIIYLKLSP